MQRSEKSIKHKGPVVYSNAHERRELRDENDGKHRMLWNNHWQTVMSKVVKEAQ